MAENRIFIKNLPFEANRNDVIEAFNVKGFGTIISCDLKPHKSRANQNAGSGYVEFKNEKDAKVCLAKAPFVKPMCKGRKIYIYKTEKKVEKILKDNDLNEIKNNFILSSFEVGSWGEPVVHNSVAEQFTFSSEWKYPEDYENPRISFSKIEEAFILEGFNLPRNSCDLFVTGTPDTLKKRIKIPFRNLAENSRGMFLDVRDDVISLYINLKHPPYLYREVEKNLVQLKLFLRKQTRNVERVRTVDWTEDNVFGKCLVYRVIFKDDLGELRDTLEKFKFRGVPRPIPQVTVRRIESPIYSNEYFANLINELPFRISFKLESLISSGELTLYEIEENKLGERLLELVRKNQEVVAWYALNQILTKYWDPFDIKYQNRPISIFEIAVKGFKNEFNVWYPSSPNLQLTNNSRCAWINHATITPTTVYYDGPNYEASNRILRLYKDKIDHFLRVTFREENLGRLFVNKDEDSDIINLRIVAILNNGFHLAGRQYEFLAFSSSQLKETSCWFVASDGEFNANFIRANMGDLSEIRAPALYASRMGQWLTSTMGTLELTSDQVKQIDEIKRNNYDFSDGCGTISPSLAKRAAKAYWGTKKSRDDEIPSVFQIRFGGCKGVVAVDPNLKGDVLGIRPSQTKFEAPDSLSLEIVRTMKNPLPGHLNRQIILLLSTLGVPDHVFITLQNEMRKDIDSMMNNENKAREIVKRSTGSRECTHVTRTILSMIDSGIMNLDPFLMALLECKRIFSLKLLRTKARILMPKSYLLIGVIDETNTLEEDEIFVKISTIVSENQTFDTANNKIERKENVLSGPATITKNPCLHPGDVRKVKAIKEVPQLSHLKNCVVFSQKGSRPLPNIMTGGDLDGDEYFVCFDERLFISKNEDPMNYDSPGRKTVDRQIEINDVCEVFKDFMINDKLGQIDNLHLAYADSSDEGANFIGCKMLAELHSKAVDFNKTGIPVTDYLPPVDKYPDFMEKENKKSYISEKILGQLYRNIKLDKFENDSLLKYCVEDITVNDEFLFEGFEHYLEEAVIYRNHYNNEVRELMKKFKVKTEAEIMNAQLLGRQVEGRKSQDIREAIAGTISFIIYTCRKQFLMGLQDTDDDDDDTDDVTPFNLQVTIPKSDEAKAKASAWYYVTYNQKDYPDKSSKTVLLGFPWVVSDVLLFIRKEKLSG